MKIFSQMHEGGEISDGSEKTQTSFPGSDLFSALNTWPAYRYAGIFWVSWKTMVILDGSRGRNFILGSHHFLTKKTCPATCFSLVLQTQETSFSVDILGLGTVPQFFSPPQYT